MNADELRVGDLAPVGAGLLGANDEYFRQAHKNSDTDSGPNALHHTIGKGQWQAASGLELKKAQDQIKVLQTDLAAAIAVNNAQNADLTTLKSYLKRYYSMQKTADQSIPNNVFTRLVWDTAYAVGVGGGISFTNNTYVCPAGIYSVSATVRFANNTTGTRQISVRLDGNNQKSNLQQATSLSTGSLSVSADIKVPTDGGVVDAAVLQSSGGALGLVPLTGQWMFFDISWKSPL